MSRVNVTFNYLHLDTNLYKRVLDKLVNLVGRRKQFKVGKGLLPLVLFVEKKPTGTCKSSW